MSNASTVAPIVLLALAGACAVEQTETASRYPTSTSCGNQTFDAGEVCDGTELGGQTCESQGFGGGTLACRPGCRAFDVSGCTGAATCGNSRLDAGEVCDGLALAGQSCTTQGFASGDLACASNCGAFDTSGCELAPDTCGNTVIDVGEECDGTNLAGSTCTGLGYSGGALHCTPQCTLDSSGCMALETCGNGELDTLEVCEGYELRGETCVTQGFDSGQLACTSECTLDRSACAVCGDGQRQGSEVCDDGNRDGNDYCAGDCQTVTGRCGDGALQANETCDGSHLRGESCHGLGFDGGELVCDDQCLLSTAACTTCGDGQRQQTEACDDGNRVSETSCPYGVPSCQACSADCRTTLNLVGPYCGDDQHDSPELCDGSDLSGATCLSEAGVPDGDLGCAANCAAYDVSACFACSATSECSDGELCTEDGCSFLGSVSCTHHDDCGANWLCNDDGACASSTCQATSDCPSAHRCTSGVCTEIADGTSCSQHADCGWRQLCDGGECDDVSCQYSDCPDYGRCVDNRCAYVPNQSPCVSWTDCGMGQLCTNNQCILTPITSSCDDNYQCRSFCDSLLWGFQGHVCANGHCIDLEDETCKQDSDCGSLMYCGIPEPIEGLTSTCKRNYKTDGCPWCTDSYTCSYRSNYCTSESYDTYKQCTYVAPGSACEGNDDCGTNYICAPDPDGGERTCELWDGESCPNGDWDCYTGYACEDGVCVNRSGDYCTYNYECGNNHCCRTLYGGNECGPFSSYDNYDNECADI